MFFSIIVPVYNVEKFLPQCVESVLAQTFGDFELVLVDDGSPDGSGKICDQYAAKDARVVVRHIPNGGVSRARNVGLDAARGQWCVFVDSDDWLDPDFLQKNFEAISANENVDFVISGMRYLKGLHADEVVYKPAVITPREAYFDRGFFRSGGIFKAFKMSVLNGNNIRFRTDLPRGEDNVFLADFLNCAQSAAAIDYCGYNYRCSLNPSLVKKTYPFEVEREIFLSYLACAKRALNGAEMPQDILGYFFRVVFNVVKSLYRPSTKLPRRRRIECLKTLRAEAGFLAGLQKKSFLQRLFLSGKFANFDILMLVLIWLKMVALRPVFNWKIKRDWNRALKSPSTKTYI
ncbi:glycosyltransferase family 2 protein [Intestinicryptomonas porci]|uniref:Glycosyltransferase family 2 protein n=1 Tax=Intestinicryptomonas porci TaxID=2926320 RepID=A0ABU4WDU2_9BACT|nr:glycosyltransferase family 2 protein [Opitutales bacterium CLA-KB-P66]